MASRNADKKENQVEQDLDRDGPNWPVERVTRFKTSIGSHRCLEGKVVEIVVRRDKERSHYPSRDLLGDCDKEEGKEVQGIESGEAQDRKLGEANFLGCDALGVEPKEDKSRKEKKEVNSTMTLRVKRPENGI